MQRSTGHLTREIFLSLLIGCGNDVSSLLASYLRYQKQQIDVRTRGLSKADDLPCMSSTQKRVSSLKTGALAGHWHWHRPASSPPIFLYARADLPWRSRLVRASPIWGREALGSNHGQGMGDNLSQRRWNARAGEMGVPRENPPASGVVQHVSHMRKSGSAPALATAPPLPLFPQLSQRRLFVFERALQTDKSPGSHPRAATGCRNLLHLILSSGQHVLLLIACFVVLEGPGLPLQYQTPDRRSSCGEFGGHWPGVRVFSKLSPFLLRLHSATPPPPISSHRNHSFRVAEVPISSYPIVTLPRAGTWEKSCPRSPIGAYMSPSRWRLMVDGLCDCASRHKRSHCSTSARVVIARFMLSRRLSSWSPPPSHRRLEIYNNAWVGLVFGLCRRNTVNQYLTRRHPPNGALSSWGLQVPVVPGHDGRGNAGAGETGVPRENQPASGIVQHDSHMRGSGSEHARDRTQIVVVAGERPGHCAAVAPFSIDLA
ncbi:hypothetical protein PR048_014638 [Dryococelus australis]|uniref:Uncharacterized protein n=1 Tax=Dryococelus australis TaxID=614101 RepID=A0ABQ9HES4_9NEOP|nr:hypothetical protein PR048_014638 [Dryococelus australis]